MLFFGRLANWTHSVVGILLAKYVRMRTNTLITHAKFDSITHTRPHNVGNGIERSVQGDGATQHLSQANKADTGDTEE
jgi:hypothetical protein